MAVSKVLIAGGGLGGLTAAICLTKAGFDVEVYEQAPELGEVGAGVQLSANAVRVLVDIGLAPDLEAVAVKPQGYQFRLFDTAEVIQEIPLGESYVQRHGVPYYTVHRADFHDMLVRRLADLKTDAIHLSARATGFTEDDGGVTLSLEDGRTARGDVLVGADGIKSQIRAQIVGNVEAHYVGDVAWRIMVPVDRLPADQRDNGGLSTEIWVGPTRHAVVYYLRSGSILNFVGLVEYGEREDENWTARRSWDELKADFAGWHPRIQAIIDAADKDQCFRWAMNDRAPVSNWSTERATLLGDAAHPTLPYMAQGACMAIEDGAVLARCLAKVGEPEEALNMYQRNRLDRTARVVTESAANGRLFHLDTVEELHAAFSKRDMAAERTRWLFSYDPLTVELK